MAATAARQRWRRAGCDRRRGRAGHVWGALGAEGVGLMGRRRAFAEEAKDRHQ